MGLYLLIHAKLPEKYWVGALDAVTHIRKLTASENNYERKNHLELFPEKTAKRNHLGVFGCKAFVKKARSKINESKVY